MRNTCLAITFAVLALPQTAFADDHDHDHHVVHANGMRITHAWTRAAGAGENTLVFMDIENSAADDVLVSAHTELTGTVEIVGIVLGADAVTTQSLGPIEIGVGETLFDPAGLALEMTDIGSALSEGERLEITLTFEHAGEITISADVLSSDARQHPHAGHAH